MYNPYRKLVAGYARMLKGDSAFPLGTVSTSKRPTVRKTAPRVLLFSPHPDDECAVGGLALRLAPLRRSTGSGSGPAEVCTTSSKPDSGFRVRTIWARF